MISRELYKKVFEEINNVIENYKFGESNGYYMIKGILKGLKILEDNNEAISKSNNDSDKTMTENSTSSREKLVDAIEEYNKKNPDDKIYECLTEDGTQLY